ncbi:type VII secretion integral membrane protein EccD [Kineosporia sp. J2-2]|uniref:Type VII secretion integral membrane protein EccD n=1 Tax=Kineosporia corallincola TaxID=2835133 RepID=A0ABS5TP22_9ACTN|nr:type VII secretion integral membrane protein EccD [Kineosporia corallincola]MBT0772847.1 type VII secretion integral membrane protein EccD [Kineosporia corallincola]
MSTDQLCRVTIVGPDRQVDLAVPASLPLGGLLPTLVQHVVSSRDVHGGEGWILQRLGESPMDVGETPEELNWREGERLYLRRADELAPALVFDDLADGTATVVGGSPGRWRPEYDAPLFQTIAVLLVGLVGRLLLDARMEGITPFLAPVVAVLLLTASVSLSHRLAAGPAVTATVAVGLAAAVAAGTVVGGTERGIADLVALRSGPLMAAGAALAVCGVVLTVAHRGADSRTPLFPALTEIVVGLVLLTAEAVGAAWNPGEVKVAGAVTVIAALTLAYAPRSAVRLAGIRVPQLPRTASELHYDVVPTESAEMTRRVFVADQVLIAAFVSSALVLAGAIPVLISDGDGFAYALAVVVTLSVFVRAGAVRGVWQRLALVAGGMWAVAALVLWLPAQVTEPWLVVAALVLLVALLPVSAAATRPPGRRMTPVWGYLNQWLELGAAIAAIPLLAQVLGLFGLVSGLAG